MEHNSSDDTVESVSKFECQQQILAQFKNQDTGKICETLERMEEEMKKMNSFLEKICECIQDRHKMPQKPARLPISSMEEMNAFETVNEENYLAVVNYLQYIGGSNLKETVNRCFKDAIKDNLMSSFTWWGREQGQHALYNARITMAIYDAVCRNRNFQKPTRSEFQLHMRAALRTAKERIRSKSRDTKSGLSRLPRDFWCDD
ncbi:unnamed protein product [Xylocopa violacea]|uniref:DUF4806 domain-containing protein n=1 Tax=Xylocopa violacea TaxID=135666 RepID=A0ABP1NNB9_XYLVO